MNKFDFTIFFKKEEIDFLKKYNFKEEILESEIKKSEKDSWTLTELITKGVLYRYENIIQGTIIYRQLLSKIK